MSATLVWIAAFVILMFVGIVNVPIFLIGLVVCVLFDIVNPFGDDY